MKVPMEFAERRLYHFTHIRNLLGILNNGLIAPSFQEESGIGHEAISLCDIQARRARMVVPCGREGVVHDYVPFYFCPRSPMLYSIVQRKVADVQLIVYLEFGIEVLSKYDFVFTDSAANRVDPPNFYSSLGDLSKLDWDAVDTWKWGKQHVDGNVLPVKQRKMAEALIYEKVSIVDVERIVVWSPKRKNEVEAALKKMSLDIEVSVEKSYYYEAVVGPVRLYQLYRGLVKDVRERTNPCSVEFDSLSDLLDALESDFYCLPETEGIRGLETVNELHSCSVDKHTKQVVMALKASTFFRELGRKGKTLVLLAAYLHDIGKGPKSRWLDGKQKVDPDHAYRSAEMVAGILTDNVLEYDEEDAGLLLKLVCYHDIVGEVMGKGRGLRELIDVVQDVNEFYMLACLGRADVSSFNASWWNSSDFGKLEAKVLEVLG